LYLAHAHGPHPPGLTTHRPHLPSREHHVSRLWFFHSRSLPRSRQANVLSNSRGAGFAPKPTHKSSWSCVCGPNSGSPSTLYTCPDTPKLTEESARTGPHGESSTRAIKDGDCPAGWVANGFGRPVPTGRSALVGRKPTPHGRSANGSRCSAVSSAASTSSFQSRPCSQSKESSPAASGSDSSATMAGNR
jgi:hypothetical protein